MLVVMQFDATTGAPTYLPNPFSIDEQAIGDRPLWRAMDYFSIFGNDGSPSTGASWNPWRVMPIEIRSKVNLREDQAIFYVVAGVNPAASGNVTFGISLFGFHAARRW